MRQFNISQLIWDIRYKWPTFVVNKGMSIKLMESVQIKRNLLEFIAPRPDKSSNCHIKKGIYLLPCSFPHLSYGL